MQDGDLIAELKLIAGLTVAGVPVWVAVIRRIRHGRSPIAYEPRHKVPWRGSDVVVLSLIWLVFVGLAGKLESSGAHSNRAATATDLADQPAIRSDVQSAEETITTDPASGRVASAGAQPAVPPSAASANARQQRLLQLGTVASLATMGLSLAWLQRIRRADLTDFGWRREHFKSDVKLGLVSFLGIAGLLYGLQALLKGFFEGEHPIIRILSERPDPWLFLYAAIAAVIVAPLAEEFFFRVVLQGWIEAVEPAWRRKFPLLRAVPRGILPILLSSCCFALAHIEHGSAPYPLFVFALVLGYVYRQTHRVVASVVAHASLNGLSILLLWWQSGSGVP